EAEELVDLVDRAPVLEIPDRAAALEHAEEFLDVVGVEEDRALLPGLQAVFLGVVLEEVVVLTGRVLAPAPVLEVSEGLPRLLVELVPDRALRLGLGPLVLL